MAMAPVDPSPAALEALVLHELGDDERRESVVYSSGEVRPAGGVLELAGHQLTAGDDFLVCFVDLAPGANWAHRCRYLVAGVSAGVTSVPADWPPAFGPLPAPWHVLYRAPQIEDWRLLRLESSESPIG